MLDNATGEGYKQDRDLSSRPGYKLAWVCPTTTLHVHAGGNPRHASPFVKDVLAEANLHITADPNATPMSRSPSDTPSTYSHLY